jgi:hypothetical protein
MTGHIVNDIPKAAPMSPKFLVLSAGVDISDIYACTAPNPPPPNPATTRETIYIANARVYTPPSHTGVESANMRRAYPQRFNMLVPSIDGRLPYVSDHFPMRYPDTNTPAEYIACAHIVHDGSTMKYSVICGRTGMRREKPSISRKAVMRTSMSIESVMNYRYIEYMERESVYRKIPPRVKGVRGIFLYRNSIYNLHVILSSRGTKDLLFRYIPSFRGIRRGG